MNSKTTGPIKHAEGESNTSSERASWQERSLGEMSAPLLDRDATVFLHQSLSSPCVSTITKAEGTWISMEIRSIISVTVTRDYWPQSKPNWMT
jgi:hypothetical protein